MRDLLYFSQPKLRHFHSGSGSPLAGRSFEVETTAFGVGGRVAVGESGSAGAGESEGPDLETAIAHLEKTCTAHTAVPASCRSVGAYEWMEFSGPFHRGPRVRDWGLHDKGVYTFTSHENPLLCPQFTGESECSGVEVLAGPRSMSSGRKTNPGLGWDPGRTGYTTWLPSWWPWRNVVRQLYLNPWPALREGCRSTRPEWPTR